METSRIFKMVNIKKIVIITLIVLVLGICVFTYFKTDQGMDPEKRLTTDESKIAINLFFNRIENLGNHSLFIIGALLAFVVYGTAHTKRFKNIRLIFICIAILFFSYVMYFFGSRLLIELMYFHSSIDLEAPIVKWFMYWQIIFLVFGIVLSGIAIWESIKDGNK